MGVINMIEILRKWEKNPSNIYWKSKTNSTITQMTDL